MMTVMRGFVLVCAVVLAACESGVVIEVTPAPGVMTDRVRLFIGLARCDDCPGIQPPRTTLATSPELLPGAVYYREDSNRTTIIREAAVEDGVARFRIEASEIGDRFELAVAVDANNQSAALIPSLPLDSAGIYKIALVATGPAGLGPKPPETSGTFVEIWQQEREGIPCMGFERWNAGQLVGDRVFIVPQSDLDCDEVPAEECNPYAHQAQEVPAFDDVQCTTQVLENTLDVCKLGGPGCDEADGVQHDCLPSEYCVPSSYCTSQNCTAFSSPTDIEKCLFETFPTAALRCQVYFKPGAPGQAVPCDTSVPFQLGSPEFPDTICAGPTEEMMLDRPQEGAPLAFEYAISYGTFDDDTGISSTLSVKGRYEGFECKYKLELSGEVAADEVNSTFIPEATFAQFWVQRPGGPLRKLLVPIAIVAIGDPTCTQDATCSLQFQAGDSIAKCLR